MTTQKGLCQCMFMHLLFSLEKLYDEASSKDGSCFCFSIWILEIWNWQGYQTQGIARYLGYNCVSEFWLLTKSQGAADIWVVTVCLWMLTGLPKAKGIHCYPGPTATDICWFLADGVGTELQRHCHDHKPHGKRTGRLAIVWSSDLIENRTLASLSWLQTSWEKDG